VGICSADVALDDSTDATLDANANANIDVATDANIDATTIDDVGISSYGVVTNVLGICSMANTVTSITRSGKLSLI
jgi:hypothetical protein